MKKLFFILLLLFFVSCGNNPVSIDNDLMENLTKPISFDPSKIDKDK